MPWCPNPDCPHRKRTGRPAEYQVGHGTCADCGTVLVEVPRPPPRRLGWPIPLLTRLLLTASALFLVWLAGFIPLPGLDREVIAASGVPRSQYGLGMLGIQPLVTAFALVEIVALVVPWARARRRTDRALRRWLGWAAVALGMPIAAIQGLGAAFAMEQIHLGWHDSLVIWPRWPFRLGIALLLALVTGALALLARALDRWGLGPGLAALLLFGAAVDSVHGLGGVARGMFQGLLTPLGALCVLAGGVGVALATAWVLGRRPRWAQDLPAGLPVTGLFPLELGLLALMLPSSLVAITSGSKDLTPLLDPARDASLLVTGAIVLLATPIAATLFHWRRRAWWRGHTRRAWLELMAASAALVLAMAAADRVVAHVASGSLGLGALSLVLMVALALDAWDEVTLQRHAAGVSPRLLREDQDLADSLEALDALRRADPAGRYVLCGRRFRSLTYFFGPYVLLRILGMPSAKAEPEPS